MRNKIYAIIQLIILVLYIFRPILPYIDYAINKDYIAKNLCIKKDIPNNCCQGKCHLNKQIKKVEETNKTKDNNTNKKIQSKEVNEFISVYIKLPEIFEVGLNCLFFKNELFTSKFASSIFIPPEKLIFYYIFPITSKTIYISH